MGWVSKGGEGGEGNGRPFFGVARPIAFRTGLRSRFDFFRYRRLPPPPFFRPPLTSAAFDFALSRFFFLSLSVWFARFVHAICFALVEIGGVRFSNSGDFAITSQLAS